MNAVVSTRIVKIGNAHGIRIPKPMLDQLGLSKKVELEMAQDHLVIRAAQPPRCGWDEQFQVMAMRGDDQLLDENVPTLTQWDENEWEW